MQKYKQKHPNIIIEAMQQLHVPGTRPGFRPDGFWYYEQFR